MRSIARSKILLKNRLKHMRGSKTVNDVKGAVGEFLDRTTLTGVTQIASRQKFSWRMFWTAISIAGLFMSMFQTSDVMSDYINGKTIQVIDYRSHRKVQFPSLTVCSNIRLHHKKVGRDIYTKICRGKSEKDCYRVAESTKTKDVTREDDLVARLIKYQLTFQSRARKEKFHGNVVDPLLISCQLDMENCTYHDPDRVFVFNNVLHGQCLTINRAIEKGIEVGESGDIKLILNMDRESRKLKVNDIFATFWVHAPGTSPSLYADNGGHIYPGDNLKIRFTMQNITRIVGPTCYVATEHVYRALDPYYVPNRKHYLYNQKSCIMNKVDQVKQTRKCYDASMRHLNLNLALQDKDARLCSDLLKENDCRDECDDFDDDLMERIRSECKLSCNENLVSYDTNAMSLWLEKLVERSMLPNHDENVDMDFTAMNETVSLVEMLPLTHMVKTVTEEYKYKEVDFLGILGGNVSLWIGISVISLMEILELVMLVAGILSLGLCRRQSQPKPLKPQPTKKQEIVKKPFIIERH